MLYAVFYLSIIVALIVGYIVGTIVSVRVKKFDGTLKISEKDSSKIHQLEIDTEPDELGKRRFVLFRVEKDPDSW